MIDDTPAPPVTPPTTLLPPPSLKTRDGRSVLRLFVCPSQTATTSNTKKRPKKHLRWRFWAIGFFFLVHSFLLTMYLRYNDEDDHHHTSQQTMNAKKKGPKCRWRLLGLGIYFFPTFFFRYTNMFLVPPPPPLNGRRTPKKGPERRHVIVVSQPLGIYFFLNAWVSLRSM